MCLKGFITWVGELIEYHFMQYIPELCFLLWTLACDFFGVELCKTLVGYELCSFFVFPFEAA